MRTTNEFSKENFEIQIANSFIVMSVQKIGENNVALIIF